MSMLGASLFVGVCVGLVIWQIQLTIVQVPAEDRTYRDVPATGFRIIWPLVRLVVFYAGRYMPRKKLADLKIKLTRAGAEYSVNEYEVMAAKCIASAMFLSVAVLLVMINGSVFSLLALILGVAGYHYPDSWLLRKAQQRQRELLKALPFYLDVVTLSVESGSNLTGGLAQAVQKTTDSPLRRELSRVLREIRSGKTRADALREFAARADSTAINQVVSGLIQGEKAGASLGPLLRAQAEQLRTQRFQMAEKKAMQAPVKLLGPLFICIFPMTFLVLVFVVTGKLISSGVITWPLVLWAYSWPG